MSTEFYAVVLGYDGIDKEKGPMLAETYLTSSMDDAKKLLIRASIERYGESKIVKVTLEDV